MNFHFAAIFIFFFIQCSICHKCPAIYLRFSKEHSFCKPANSTCPIFRSGVTKAEARQILDLNNKLRDVVATGKEKRAGGLPQAANMMQMVWDKELASVSQRRAEQCIYEHDCDNCRKVDNFSVGQNIAYEEITCHGSGKCSPKPVPNWTNITQDFYNEVAIFDKEYVKSLKFFPGKKYMHFTQMVWSRTWRIGCGFVASKKGNGYRKFYVCNYGPVGNRINRPMYETGPFCSSCPSNSCCGKTCAHADYDGLCRMNSNNEAPAYPKKENYIFYCDFRTTTGDCSALTTVSKKWSYFKALGGYFAETVLNGGETSTLKMKNPIKPKQQFCVVMKYRSGPTVDGQTSTNSAIAIFEMPESAPTTMNLPKMNSQHFSKYSMGLYGSNDTKVSIIFKVPKGAPAQFFNIHLLTVKEGTCNTAR